MSGRGRGRGRGIPINYPDGWACKPVHADPYPVIDPAQLPKALRLHAADHELLAIKRRLASAPASRSFFVTGAARPGARRNLGARAGSAPATRPFSESDALSMQPNLHFPNELKPPRKKRPSAAGASDARQPRRLRRGPPSMHADEHGRFADAFEEAHDEVGEEAAEGEEGASGAEEEEEEEDDEDPDYAGGSGFDEDGGDDLDSGGEGDEPTY